MNCYKCGTITDNLDICPVCGADQHIYRRILKQADVYYNDGLMKARVRDLSGASRDLKMCLKCNKYHTDARNLLGLVYYEVGEAVSALAQWVISKNLQPENNRVDVYLDELQNTAGLLDSVSLSIKKYNQALDYCKQGNRDLARIQLRRVLGQNPKMVAAHQLLALLCIQDGEYEEARKSLSAANKVDSLNAVTLRYMIEVKEGLKAQDKNKKKKKKKDDIISFTDGNETIMMPNNGNKFTGWLDSSRNSIINILIGLVVGLLICFVLVVPTVKQKAQTDAANALVDANEEVAGTSSSISSLRNQVKSLQEELAKYTGKGDVVTSYDKLIEAYNAYKSNDITKATECMSVVNPDLLDVNGKAIYNEVNKVVNEKVLRESYNAGYTAYRQGNYEQAVNEFLKGVAIDPTYQNSNLLYYLADSYAKLNDIANATKYHQQLVSTIPNSKWVNKSKEYLTSVNAAIPEPAVNATTTTTTTNTYRNNNAATTNEQPAAEEAPAEQAAEAAPVEGQ
ncbi:MAG: tetratricopeptide repeat protein [Lachnospiraceae bacterium]|nr:tetratricopeptide repeat protein [Lachnospiraceae bacterium]